MKRIKMALLAGTLIFTLHSCKECEECTKASYRTEPSCIIPIENAQEMYRTYTKKRVQIIQKSVMYESDGSPFRPTRYVEMDYEKLKHYLTYIESESKKANTKISRLRFYLATYPEADYFISGDSVKVPKHNTIFMLPTTLVNNEHLGFFTRGNGEKNRKPVFFKDLNGEMKGIRGLTREKIDSTKIIQASFFTIIPPNPDDDRSLVGDDMNVVPPPKGNTEMDPNEENSESVKPNNDDLTQQQGNEIEREVSEQN